MRVTAPNPNHETATYILPMTDWEEYAQMGLDKLHKMAKQFEADPQNKDLPWITRFSMPLKADSGGLRWKKEIIKLLTIKPTEPVKRKVHRAAPAKGKRRKKLTLEQKIKAIKEFQNGEYGKNPRSGILYTRLFKV